MIGKLRGNTVWVSGKGNGPEEAGVVIVGPHMPGSVTSLGGSPENIEGGDWDSGTRSEEETSASSYPQEYECEEDAFIGLGSFRRERKSSEPLPQSLALKNASKFKLGMSVKVGPREEFPSSQSEEAV